MVVHTCTGAGVLEFFLLTVWFVSLVLACWEKRKVGRRLGGVEIHSLGFIISTCVYVDA